MHPFVYTNNIYGRYGKDPRRLLSTSKATNLEVERHWEGTREPELDVTSRDRNRDQVKKLWVGSVRRPESSYRQVYSETAELIEERKSHEFTHHRRRDWLKDYLERCPQSKKIAR